LARLLDARDKVVHPLLPLEIVNPACTSLPISGRPTLPAGPASAKKAGSLPSANLCRKPAYFVKTGIKEASMTAAPPSSVIAAFRRTARQMVAELVDRMTAAGFDGASPATHAVFENLDREGTRITDLAARADMTRQSMSELVAVLEKRGWVRRHADPADRRAQIVRLTPEGRRVVRAALQAMAEIEKEWQARWRRAGCRTNLRTVIEAALADAAPVQKRPIAPRRAAAKAAPGKGRIPSRRRYG
jgi:DNA-binding MarR family transcriptional regulator